MVASTMVANSPIYKQQYLVASDLASRGIHEEVIDYEITNAEIVDNSHCKLTSEEKVSVIVESLEKWQRFPPYIPGKQGNPLVVSK